MDATQISLYITATLGVLLIMWYLFDRYMWYRNVISKNPSVATLKPVLTSSMVNADPTCEDQIKNGRVVAPRANFRQYLRYLQLACIPYIWSVPIKLIYEFYTRQFSSKLTITEKRQRLARMVLETSLILLFDTKSNDTTYQFTCKDFMMPSRVSEDKLSHHVDVCKFEIKAEENEAPILTKFSVDNTELENVDSIFSFLNTLWCVYTHTLTHIQAGNIAEINLKDVKTNMDIEDDLKQSIDDMHSAVSGMNESANHYPADIWGIPRKNLQYILGYNGVQQIKNHQNIVKCLKISDFVSFTMKARKVYAKHLSKTGLSISTLSANTIFHSIDHYNMGKYMLHERAKKSYLGIDSRMITSLLGKLNYDLGHWQRMKYTKYATWRAIYLELKDIDAYLADKVHMFVSV